MSKKLTTSTKDITLMILVVISIISICLSLFILLKIKDLRADFIMLNTKSDYLTTVKFECAKNPSDSCQQELHRSEKDLKDYIDRIKQ